MCQIYYMVILAKRNFMPVSSANIDRKTQFLKNHNFWKITILKITRDWQNVEETAEGKLGEIMKLLNVNREKKLRREWMETDDEQMTIEKKFPLHTSPFHYARMMAKSIGWSNMTHFAIHSSNEMGRCGGERTTQLQQHYNDDQIKISKSASGLY